MNRLQTLLPARIERGTIKWKDPVKLSGVLSSLNGQDVNVAIKPHRNSRSYNQNRYYWGVIISILADFTGYSKDEMHEVLKGKFLSDEKEIAGEQIRFSYSTAELNTVEFEQYLTDIREWASVKLGLFIPLPNEVAI